MRIKSRWFKNEREKTPQEIAGALAFDIWRISGNALKNTRKADFDIAIGNQYFSFLTEFLVFLVQVADRIAHRQFPVETRFVFTSALANRVAETLAENQSRLMGNSISEYKRHFIDKLNRRAGEYAEFNYGSDGKGFAFTRYLGYCLRDVVDEKDATWIIDQIMSIEAPEAVTMVENTMHGLLDTEPGQPRSRKAAGDD